MSLLFLDGFDFYGSPKPNDGPAGFGDIGTGTGASGGDVTNQLGTSTYTAVRGCKASSFTRTGYGQSIQFDTPIYSGFMTRPIPACKGVVVGFAYYAVSTSALFGSNGYKIPFSVGYDNLVGTVAEQFHLTLNDVAGISVIDGGGNLLAATPPLTIFPNAWNYIECKVTTAGLIQVRLNGQVVASVSGAKAGILYNLVTFKNDTSDYFGSAFIDDVYVLSVDDLDGTGTFTDFQGDCVVHGIPVVSDFGPNQCSQFGGSIGHFSSVNTFDEDTSYLFTNIAGNVELFGLDTLPNDILEVLAVSVNARARKDSAGIAHYEMIARLQGSSTISAGPALNITTSYLTRDFIMTQKPGGGAWTLADAQGLKIGFSSLQ